MGLEQIRDRARAQVHAQFSIPAVVRSPDGSAEVEVAARLHRNVRKPIGDLDREGFALVIEEANGIIIDREEWEPKKNWKIDFGRDRVFNIDTINDDEGERYVRMHVSFKRP